MNEPHHAEPNGDGLCWGATRQGITRRRPSTLGAADAQPASAPTPRWASLCLRKPNPQSTDHAPVHGEPVQLLLSTSDATEEYSWGAASDRALVSRDGIAVL